ncbi:alpha/beta hydrolase [Actinokineospora guangxiensis]|uniref:Alpha/beta hydrolase n=1 Tax=Actinokineospora guangxiensis TaxID=1490288 RepID=A0ABW0EVF8_9PSEU
MTTIPEDLDRQYSPSSCVADIEYYLHEYAARSAGARAVHRHHVISYGPSPAEKLDLFPHTEGCPLLVYIHGGNWQQLSKDESSFAASAALFTGTAFAALGYGLAPDHRLDEIVAMVRRGLLWLVRNAAAHGIAADRIHLSGSSAGAHLAAMAFTGDWLIDGRTPAEVFRSVTLLSGIYDLEPIRNSYVNDALRLTPESAHRNSPLHHVPPTAPPILLARGGRETAAYARQQDAYVSALRARGLAVRDLVVEPRNHFDLPFDLLNPDTALGSEIVGRLRAEP